MKKYTHYFTIISLLFLMPILLYLFSLKIPRDFKAIPMYQYSNATYPIEKRGIPAYDTIIGSDGLPHFRVFFWVPKTAKQLTPYADPGVITNVSSHGPAEKWSVVETQMSTENEKLVFIYVPKTFVFLYGEGFEKVIHLKYIDAHPQN